MKDEPPFPNNGAVVDGLTKLEWFAVGTAELCVSDAFTYADKMLAEAAKRKAGK